MWGYEYDEWEGYRRALYGEARGQLGCCSGCREGRPLVPGRAGVWGVLAMAAELHYEYTVGMRVRLQTPENSRLDGAMGTITALASWGAYLATASSGTGQYRALWEEMVPCKAQEGGGPVLVVNRHPEGTGEMCAGCGGLMVRTGTCLTCQGCGATSGGCS